MILYLFQIFANFKLFNNPTLQLGTFKVKDFKDCPKFGIEFSDFIKNIILSYFQNLVSLDFCFFYIFWRVLAPEFIKTKLGNTSNLDFEKMDVKDLRY